MWWRLTLTGCGGLPAPAALVRHVLVGGALRLDLGGEGLDGGERGEWGLGLRQDGFLVHTELAILRRLRQQVIRQHWHHQGGRRGTEPGGGAGVGGRGALRLEVLGGSWGEEHIRASGYGVRWR